MRQPCRTEAFYQCFSVLKLWGGASLKLYSPFVSFGCLQVLLSWSCYVGRGCDSVCVLLTECICNAVKGEVRHTLTFTWQQKVCHHKTAVTWLRDKWDKIWQLKVINWACSHQQSFKHQWALSPGNRIMTVKTSAFVNQVSSLFLA